MLKKRTGYAKLLSWMLCVAMVVTMLPSFRMPTLAADAWSYPTANNPPSGMFSGGGGIKEDPYRIATAQDLADLAYIANQGYTSSYDYYVLTADIDLGGTKAWTPIGTCTNKESTTFDFEGNFDGNGHTIRGLKIAKLASYQGLFGYICCDSSKAGGVVKNLKVEGNIKAGSYSGGIVGKNGGTIENCIYSGTITGCNNGAGRIGGIVGSNHWNVLNCYNEASVIGVEGSTAFGGICGESINGSHVTNCYNVGLVSFDSEYPDDPQINGARGGIVGENKGTIQGTYFLSGTAKKGVGYEERGDAGSEAKEITEDQLKKTNTFQNWDFENTWKMTANGPVQRCFPGEEAQQTDENEATVALIWGTVTEGEHGLEPDRNSLEISDAAVAGKNLIGKFISDGDYELQEGDLDLGLLFNNANVTMGNQNVTVFQDSWEMSGDSSVSFGNMQMTSSAENFAAYNGAMDAKAIYDFYSAYPYRDRQVDEYHVDRRGQYDCTITGDYTAAGQIRANVLTVGVGTTLTLDSFRFWDEERNDWDTETSGGTINCNKLFVYGTIKTNAATKAENPPLIEIFEHGSIVVGANGGFVPCNGTELVLGDYATWENIDFYRLDSSEEQGTTAVSYAPSAKHGRESFLWFTQYNRWIAIGGSIDNETVLVSYDGFSDFDGNAQAKVYVNDGYVKGYSTTEFVTGQPMTVKLRPSEERMGCLPLVRITSRSNGSSLEWNSWGGGITLQENQAEGGYDFTFTPVTDKALDMTVYWSKYDSMYPDGDSVILNAMVMEGNANGAATGAILVEGDWMEMANEPNAEGRARYRFSKDYFQNDATIKLTFVPADGHCMRNVFTDAMGDYELYAPKDTKEENELALEDNGFTDNGDGSYSCVITKLPENESGTWEFQFSTKELPGSIQICNENVAVQYLVGEDGEYRDLTKENNYRISHSEIANASQVTLRAIPQENQKLYGLEIFWRVNGEIQGNRYSLSENNTYTIYKQDGWKDYSVDIFTEKVPLDNQYNVKPMGGETLTFSDDRQVCTNYEFTVGTPIDFTFEENVYKVIVYPAFGESEEISVNGKHFSYTPQSKSGLQFDVYVSQERYDFEHFEPDYDENEYLLHYSLHHLHLEGSEDGSGSVSVDKNPIRQMTVGDDTKLIYDRDTVKKVTLTITPSAGSTYVIREDKVDITESVKANGNTYVWDASDEDNYLQWVDIDFVPVSYLVEVQEGGQANYVSAFKGQVVELTAGAAPEGKVFDKWEVVSGGVTLTNANASTTTFVMGVSNVVVKAVWKDAALNVKYTHTCTVGNDLSLNYYIESAPLAGYENIRLVVEKKKYGTDDTYTIQTKTISTYSIGNTGTNSAEEYKFTYRGLYAYEMGDELKAKIVAEKDGVTYESNVDTYSIKTYAINNIKKTTVADKLKRLLVDMLNYGAQAQIYFNYNKANLVNAELTDAMLAYGTTGNPTLTSYKETIETAGATASFKGHTLITGSNIELKYYMGFDDGVNLGNVTVRMSYTAVDGTPHDLVIPASQFNYDSAADEYSCKIATVATKDFSCKITAGIYEGDKLISPIDLYSIGSYINNQLGKPDVSDDIKALLAAMGRYGVSAQEYFKK